MTSEIITKTSVPILSQLLLCLCLLSAPMQASIAADEESIDPFEGFNRKVFAFNDFFDRIALKPLAKGYQFITPAPVDRGVTNFFSNLDGILIIVNDLLQGKVKQAGQDSARFLVNSTIGIVGIFDVASKVGLAKHQEDFGQTFGSWGIPSGPYIVLPFLGPSNVRDAFGRVPDYFADPVTYVEDDPTRWGLFSLNQVDVRADLISAEALISGDRYTFIRDAYMQRREYLVADGEVEDDFLDEDFDEEDYFDEEEEY